MTFPELKEYTWFSDAKQPGLLFLKITSQAAMAYNKQHVFQRTTYPKPDREVVVVENPWS